MPMNQWQVGQYQMAAEQMCFSLNEQPHEPVMLESRQEAPRWVLYAIRMAEHALMVETMRQYGHNV